MLNTSTSQTLLSSSAAFAVARVDRVTFNDAASDGYYPCAPVTSKGKVRKFDSLDLIVLYVFGRLRDVGFITAKAGAHSCRLMEWLKDQRAQGVKLDAKKSVTLILGDVGGLDGTPMQFTWDRNIKQQWASPGLGIQTFLLTIELDNIRRSIAESIEQEGKFEQADEE